MPFIHAMPYDHNQSRELHGIGSSFNRGTKRTADNLVASHPYSSIQDKQAWKNAPSVINTISTRRQYTVPVPNAVPNPYSGISTGKRSSVKPNGSNPTASRTVTDAMPSKKRKTSGGPSELGPSKFWAIQGQSRGSSARGSRAVPSTLRTYAGTTRTRPGVLPSNRDQRPARSNREILLLTNPRTPSAGVINIDESGSDVDKDSGTVNRHSPPQSDNADEIDLIDQPIDQLLSPRKYYQSENLSVAQELGVPEPGLDHPFLSKDTSSLYTRATSPTLARRIAKDGASTERLGGRLHVHIQQQDQSAYASDTPSSPLTPPPPLSADGNEDNDEIEDAEGFSSTLTVSSSKVTAARRVQRRLSNRASASGSSTIKRGRVKEMADEIEEKSKANSSRFIPDLKQVGGQKSRIGGMKRKNPSAIVNLDEIILVYPPSGQGAVHITNGDLRRLEPSEFLNDTLIELGLKFWLNDLCTQQPELAEDIHVFSSFFFKKLASKNNKTPEDGHKSVRKWTAKVDIFKKKYIIVPINENIHWYLAIIFHPEHILQPSLPMSPLRTIIFCMDSLGSSHPKALNRLNEYLQEEAKDKKGIENPSSALTKKALVPVQPNFCDCGLYLMHFAQTFMTDPEKYKADIFATKSAAADRNMLWLNEQVGTMREGMKARILAESKTWKKLKAQRAQETKGVAAEGDAGQLLPVEQSDDEIEVSEVRHVGSPPKKQSKKAPPNPAARIR